MTAMRIPIRHRKEKKNVYAKDIKGKEIHISEAESGRKGYYCLGCDREMQAVKSKRANRISYFRHDPKDVVNKGKCTYSDETYRHKLAKEILVRIKQIKVPAVYKDPPHKYEGQARLIKQSEIIYAHHVEVERHFYEDDNGKILWGSQSDSDGKNLLIVPDVAFFNEVNEPILFIEIVAKHRVDDEKKIKIRRLGVNAVQVSIPKDSPVNIERAFFTTEHTKWIFNYEQAITDYFRISEGDSKGISPIDELQRKFFEETFRCRSAQIRNLLRAINKCLGSKQYREIEESLRSEIRRVENNTENDSRRLQGIQRKYDEEAFDELKGERTRIESEEGRILRLLKRLHDRYETKRKESERQENKRVERIIRLSQEVVSRYRRKEEEFTAGIEAELRKHGFSGSTFAERKRNLEREIEDEELLIKQEETIIRQLEELTGSLPGKFERDKDKIRSEFGKLEDEERGTLDDVSERRETIRERFEKLTEETLNRFEELRKQSADRIKKRDGTGDTELSNCIEGLLRCRGLLLHIQAEKSAYKRNKRAWDSFKSGAFKSWDFS